MNVNAPGSSFAREAGGARIKECTGVAQAPVSPTEIWLSRGTGHDAGAPHDAGTSTALGAWGASCTSDAQCASHSCFANMCRFTGLGARCHSDANCNSHRCVNTHCR